MKTSQQFYFQLAEVKKIIGPSANLRSFHLPVHFNMINRRKNHKSWSRYYAFTKRQRAAAKHLDVALHRVQMALRSDDLTVGIKSFVPEEEIQAARARIARILSTRPKLAPKDKPRRYAVRLAAQLLERHGLPITATRGGKFCRLAAVLYGDRRTNFYHDCCDFLKGRKQGAKRSPARP